MMSYFCFFWSCFNTPGCLFLSQNLSTVALAEEATSHMVSHISLAKQGAEGGRFRAVRMYC